MIGSRSRRRAHGCATHLQRFHTDERGNFAIMAIILVVPMLLAGMLAMDSANLMRTRNNVQAGLDASTLAVGKKFSTGAETIALKVYGRQVFDANLTAIAAVKVSFPSASPTNPLTTSKWKHQPIVPFSARSPRFCPRGERTGAGIQESGLRTRSKWHSFSILRDR
nr:TadE/TadG family type IV pilus assembly protein [Ochrobactrum sp. CM-21-5]